MKNFAQRIFRAEMWGISVALHVGVLLLVLFCPPVQRFLFSRSKPQDLVVSEERLQEILEEMLELNRAKAERMVADLGARQAAIDAIQGRQVERLAAAREGAAVELPMEEGDAVGAAAAADTFRQAYESACAIEARIVNRYKAIRALGMAMMRPELTVQEAFDATTVMRPARPTIPDGVFDIPIPRDDEARLDAFRSELKKAGKELSSIAAYCEKILEFATDIDVHADGMTMNLFMDDTDIYGGGYTGPTLMPDEMYDSHEFSMGSFSPIPGRKLLSKGQANLWAYVDNWYIIGPFPNERRRALDTKFGPEAGVDLDATYVGKNGRELQWDYVRSSSLKVEPPNVDRYGIYYAYSEIYSDKEQDVWISTGTDDYGKLWINDEHIWSSPPEPKAFKADEHVQLVRLRQGYNDVLIRCENAGGTMGMCLLFCTVASGAQ